MTTSLIQPGLFGLVNTNRDFTRKAEWGKNKFNNSFPVTFACYMGYNKLEPVYLCLDNNLNVVHKSITIETLFGLKELSSNLRFNFEADYNPHTRLAIGGLPRIDLVTVNSQTTQSLRALEIKLTTLPDNQTCKLREDQYGSEIVVRPDTIVYLGLNICATYANDKKRLLELLEPVCSQIKDWADALQVKPLLEQFVRVLDKLLLEKLDYQLPLLMQPIWKTEGKSGILADHCLDLFIWSDFGLTRLFIDAARQFSSKLISRQARAVFWLAKMLYDFARDGRFAPQEITEKLVYGPRNDKAFSITGTLTHRYMTSTSLTQPRVPKEAIREIILGDGQNFLSPERRLDAIIVNTPGLFNR